MKISIDVKDTKITQKRALEILFSFLKENIVKKEKSKLIYNNHVYFTVKQTNESSYEILEVWDFKGEDKENDL